MPTTQYQRYIFGVLHAIFFPLISFFFFFFFVNDRSITHLATTLSSGPSFIPYTHFTKVHWARALNAGGKVKEGARHLWAHWLEAVAKTKHRVILTTAPSPSSLSLIFLTLIFESSRSRRCLSLACLTLETSLLCSSSKWADPRLQHYYITPMRASLGGFFIFLSLYTKVMITACCLRTASVPSPAWGLHKGQDLFKLQFPCL